MPVVPPSSDEPSISTGSEQRAERLLAALSRVFRHDLPNQLVVFEGLLQLLEYEEQERLSPQAVEYLQRLKSVSKKTMSLGRHVKELSNLVDKPGQAEPVNVPFLLEELKARVRQIHQEQVFAWEHSIAARMVEADAEALLRSLVELIGLTVALSAGTSFRILFQVFAAADSRGARLVIRPEDGKPLPVEAKPWESRVEFVLARELLLGWGGDLQLNTQSSPGVEFLLAFPG